MSHLSSAHIAISSAYASGIQRPTGSILANSPVLDFLMPQLSVWQTKGHKVQQRLENIDAYMLQETEQLLERVGTFCLKLGLCESTSFTIKRAKPALCISGQFAQKPQLDELVNQDRWIGGAFNWLYGNYSALAHSQELISFSNAYKKDRHQALGQYKHFEQRNQGVDCYVKCSLSEGKANLSWVIESPVGIYHLDN